MNRNILLTMTMMIGIILAACTDTENTADEHEQMADELNPEQENTPDNPQGDNKLGYVRYKKDQIDNDNENNHSVNIDRTKMANMITRMILRSDGFDEVATLVTDEETLIAYAKQDDMDSQKAADIANKTAVSVLPGYFEIYVSENDMLIQDIQSLHNANVQDNDYDNTINQIIERMQESPQGMEETN